MQRAIFAAIVVCGASISGAENSKPNIVFILADDVGVDAIGCYGGSSYPTPNIDRLASEGMRFTHGFSMAVCHPTRTTFLLGKYPLHSGNPRWGSFPKDLESQTVATILRKAGYATAVAGKWQLALLGKDLDHPNRLGFDEYCLFGWHEGARYYDPLIWQNGKKVSATSGKYGPDIYVQFLNEFIKRNRDKPFFAFYSMALCHDVTDDLDGPVPYAPGKDRYLNFGEMMVSMDDCVGRVIATLDKLKLRERTLIVFTGDNGTAKGTIIRAEPSGDDGQRKWKYVREANHPVWRGKSVPGGKGNLTDDGTNVPLICNWLGKISGDQVVDDLVDCSDYLPTFAKLGGAGSFVPQSIDGHSFARRVIADQPGNRQWAFAQHKERYWVRTRQWKLYDDGKFFDVRSDPYEKKVLPPGDPRHSDYSMLKKTLDTFK